MDLYEALKNGTSPEDLRATFEKELAAAQSKHKSEDVKAKALAQTRADLASIMVDYILLTVDAADDMSDDEKKECADAISDALESYENKFSHLKNFDWGFSTLFDSTDKPVGFKAKASTKDEDIIAQFLASLK